MTGVPALPPVEQLQTDVGPLAIRRTPTRGAGPHEPAILVHGLGGYGGQWVDLADALADRLECVAIDLPGFGWSEPNPDGDHSLTSLGVALRAAVGALFGDQPVHVLGNSMGGLLGVQLAARHPELVRTLCLISPAMPGRVPMRSNLFIPVIGMPLIGPFVLDRQLAGGATRMARSQVELIWSDPRRIPTQRLAELEAEIVHMRGTTYGKDVFRGTTASVVAAFLETGSERPWALARRVQAPTLVVYGREDRLVDPRTAHRSAREFREGLVLIIPDCGHVAMLERPELVARWWRHFVDQHESASADPATAQTPG